MTCSLQADLEAIDASLSTPLHCACWKGHTDVVEKLLEKGANPLAVTESGWNPIHSAAFRGHAAVVKAPSSLCTKYRGYTEEAGQGTSSYMYMYMYIYMYMYMRM
jgi:hypothetical protein